MFTVKKGNLFDNVVDGFIVHGCNAQGVMGSGVAAVIRKQYPIAYQTYLRQAPNYILGEVIPAIVDTNLVIVNAITQEYYGTDRVHADYDAIEQAFRGVKHLAQSEMIESTDIHFPMIGGGLAGGDLHTIMTIMDRQFANPSEGNDGYAGEGTLWLLPEMYNSLRFQ